MEAEERPSKIRKLSHDRIKSTGADTAKVAGNLLLAQSNGSSTARGDSALFSCIPVQDSSNDNAANEANGLEPENDTAESLLSKNQLKKLRRKQEWEAGRDFRKAKRRDKAKEKKARKRAEKEEQKDSSTTTSNPNPNTNTGGFQPFPGPRYRLPVTFVLDCGFDDLMTEKERISLGSQLTRAYSDNGRAQFQAHLCISSWGGEVRKRFDGLLKGMYKNWKGVVVTEDDFVEVAKRAGQEMRLSSKRGMVGAFRKYVDSKHEEVQEPSDETLNGEAPEKVQGGECTGENGLNITTTENDGGSTGINSTEAIVQQPPHPGQRVDSISPDSDQSSGSTARIVYLTSDSPHTLTELKPYHTYVIGGLVDKNRHKGICYKTACDRGVETAKLPISEYMRMTSRYVLATNHVVEIMLRWLETGDWGLAFLQVMPKRKGAVLKTDTSNEAAPGSSEGAEAEADHDTASSDSDLEEHLKLHHGLSQVSESGGD